MLSEKEYYHDLINNEVIDLLNLQKEELTSPKIIYSKYETPEKWLVICIIFPNLRSVLKKKSF